MNADNLELRRILPVERTARQTEREWIHALLEEERSARQSEANWIYTAKLYCTRSTGGARFHTNRLCGGLQDEAPRELTYCGTCSKARAKARARGR